MQADDILPILENGQRVLPGERVRLPDGSLMLVRTVALTADGAYVSDSDVAGGARAAFEAADDLGSADYDTQEDLEADAVLPLAVYVKKRALDLPADATREDKLAAMTRDILARQRAIFMNQMADENQVH